MARKFNLQPWRDQLRARQKQQFTAVTAVIALIAIAVCGGYYFLRVQYQEDQLVAIATLDKNIGDVTIAQKEVDKAKKLHEEVTKQILVIQNLQDQRSLTVEILNYLATQTPETVFIDSVNYSDSLLTIKGTAENEMGVSNFISILQNFPQFEYISLINMEKAKSNDRYTVSSDTGVRSFSLQIKVKPIKTNDGAKE